MKYIVKKRIWFMERGAYPFLGEIFKQREYRFKLFTMMALELFGYIEEYEEPQNSTVATGI